MCLISIVDDDAGLRAAMTRLMRSLGHSSTMHLSAEEFLASDAVERADCVITDNRMPGLDGFQLKIELNSRGIMTPVIMLTARPDGGMERRAREYGMVLFPKPFDAGALCECLSTILRGR